MLSWLFKPTNDRLKTKQRTTLVTIKLSLKQNLICEMNATLRSASTALIDVLCVCATRGSCRSWRSDTRRR